MDIATIVPKQLKKQKILKNLYETEENNACSITVDVKIDGKNEKYVLMFKNETHNHPTEIEPYGGAATCLGGAIRDPLSGRTYVYQAMRVTGCADPTQDVSKTLTHKLPQRTITIGAAKGYSSYGNQIGLSTGQVEEIYHPDYVAKRLEVGAVIGAAPIKNIYHSAPCDGDVIILLGGRTGKDGVGGATGSSKKHHEKSLESLGAEVQKGNPICERKIQRLFRNPVATKLIKKCNDFGAGGVCVAIGELCDGLDINLDAVPKKYEGLDGTELAISESQERMAVVVNKNDAINFIKLANSENLEATIVAKVTNTNRLRMY
jgi:phosphoribosylformylglycinamidine synthase